jgi:concanavalin A-like lectin/glucanase superfamily protein/carbohydrate binding protein with CBM4/9 domain
MALLAAFSFDSGDAHDDSGNGNDGTVNGTGVSFGAGGHTADGMLIDGSDESCISLPTSVMPTEAVTVSAWVNMDDDQTTGFNYLVGAAFSTSHDDTFMIYGSAAAHATLEISTTGTPAGLDIVGDDIRGDGWHHLAATYDGSTATFYMDGEVVDTASVSGALSYGSSPQWTIGCSLVGTNEVLKGVIDDVRIYDNALTQAQIVSDMNTPVTSGSGSGPGDGGTDPGGNHIGNPSFETDASGWSGFGSATIAQASGDAANGSHYLLVTATQASGQSGAITTSAFNNVAADSNYMFSVAIKSPVALMVSLNVDWSDFASGTYISTDTKSFTVQANSWQQITGIFTSPDATGWARPYATAHLASGATFEVDNVAFELYTGQAPPPIGNTGLFVPRSGAWVEATEFALRFGEWV